jgi:hypothetical protein
MRDRYSTGAKCYRNSSGWSGEIISYVMAPDGSIVAAILIVENPS